MDLRVSVQSDWVPQYADRRDFLSTDDRVVEYFPRFSQDSSIPDSVDIRSECDEFYELPVSDDIGVNSVVVGCIAGIEYGELRYRGKVASLSPQFIQQTAWQHMDRPAGSAMDIRSILKTIKRFGSPPNHIFKNTSQDVQQGIQAGYTREFENLVYFRIDENQDPRSVINEVKRILFIGLPVIFGFPVPVSTSQRPLIPYRPKHDSILSGQAVLAVGYDDNSISRHQGALLIRTNWGENWGDNGYGWLPYEFLTGRIATDYWVVADRGWELDALV